MPRNLVDVFAIDEFLEPVPGMIGVATPDGIGELRPEKPRDLIEAAWEETNKPSEAFDTPIVAVKKTD